METAVDNAAEVTSSNKPSGPRFRLHFFASFLICWLGLALVILVVFVASIFTLRPGDSLFLEWPVLLLLLGTYGVVIALISGLLFGFLSSYRVTEDALVQATLFEKKLRIPWAEVLSVEPVRPFSLIRVPVFRIVHEGAARPLHFINCLSKRKEFDLRVTEYTDECHPFRKLLRKPKPKTEE